MITFNIVRRLTILLLSSSPAKLRIFTTSPPQRTISKESPFTRFLHESDSQKRKIRGDKNQERAPTSTPPGSPGQPETVQEETGTTRLERLLTEAAEETTEKMRRKYFTSEPSCSKTVVTESVIRVQPNEETPSTTKSDVTQKDTRQNPDSSSTSDSDSSSEPSSCDDWVTVRERTIKHQGKRKASKESPPWKSAKHRYVLACWMYQKYPILKFFVTAPSDAVRYPYMYRCRVCLVELPR